MINIVVLAGTVVELPILKKTKDGVPYASIVLEIIHSLNNHYSQSEKDHITVKLKGSLAEVACSCCKIGSMLGIKGRIDTFSIERDGQIYQNYEIIGEHITQMN